jgi:hypothetical protein
MARSTEILGQQAATAAKRRGRSAYIVSSVDLPAIPNIHDGTGHHENNRWCVAPASVPGTGRLSFEAKPCGVTCLLYALADQSAPGKPLVPNWFGVAIPDGLTDFSNVTVFFHPIPGQAGYKDADYPTKTGLWPNLFYYMELLGYQLAGSGRAQVVVMPFLTNGATNTGVLPADWQDILTEVLRQARTKVGADDGSPLTVANVAIASFSVGIVYMMYFRDHAAGLSASLREIWDFDGIVSSAGSLSSGLASTPTVRAIKYDELSSASGASYHLPTPRWPDRPAGPPNDVHHLIIDYMFLHAASVSGVGGAIPPPSPPAPAGGVPSGTGVPSPGGVPGGTGVPSPGGVPGGTGVPSPGGIPTGTGVTAPPGDPSATGTLPLPSLPSATGVPTPPNPQPVLPPDFWRPLPGLPAQPNPPQAEPLPDPAPPNDSSQPAHPALPPPATVARCCDGCQGDAVAVVGSVSAVAVTAITAVTALARGGTRAPAPPAPPPRI